MAKKRGFASIAEAEPVELPAPASVEPEPAPEPEPVKPARVDWCYDSEFRPVLPPQIKEG